MATLEQEVQERQALKSVLDQLNAIEPDSLVRTEVLGKELSFEAGLPVFRRTLALFHDLSECNLDGAPYETLSQMTSQAKQALTSFQQIRNFSIQQNPSNPAAARDSLINQLRDQWNSCYTAITPHISYAVRHGTDFAALEREARGSLSLLKEFAATQRTEADKMLAEMKGALEKVRQAAAEAGVAQHAVHFKQEADAHRQGAFAWMAVTVTFAVVAAWYAVHSLAGQLHSIPPDATLAGVAPLVLPRIVVISVFFFGLAWGAKNYAASRHNFVINRHRQNALSTFETFVKASSDEQTKNAVLLQATQSIFALQSSGYLKGESEAPQGNQVIELVRNVTGTKE